MRKDQKSDINTHAFFENSTYLDLLSLKPLSHIHPHWELIWNNKNEKYTPEENSFAGKLNEVLAELDRISPPEDYHKFEDIIIEHVEKEKNGKVLKIKGEWVKNIKDEIQKAEYDSLLEQGSFDDPYEYNLLKAAKGRMKAALERDQNHFDDMEHSHQIVLATIISIILYQRAFT